MRRLALLVLPILALAACGETDEERMRATATLWAKTDPAVCDSMSQNFIDSVFRDGGLKACKMSAARDKQVLPIKFREVAIRDDKSTLTGMMAGVPIRAEFIKQGDDWQLDSFRFVAPDGRQETEVPTQSLEPQIRKGLDPRATVDSYYQAIRDEDAAALCGLLSRSHAVKVLGGDKRATPIADCVQELQDYDWSKTRKQAAGIKAVKVTRASGRATVTVSSGKRAMLAKDEGRWVVDEIKP